MVDGNEVLGARFGGRKGGGGRRTLPLAELSLTALMVVAATTDLAAEEIRGRGSVGVTAPAAIVEAGSDFGAAVASGDYNSDGLSDLLVGAPTWTSPAGAADSGGWVLYRGTASGFSPATYLSNSATTSTFTGTAVEMGDFDGDGRDDLAIGVPGDSFDGSSSGAVLLRWFDGTNFDASDLRQSSSPSLDPSEPFDRFGEVLAVGNFNGDAYDDLVVGLPGENLEDGGGTFLDAGSVRVFYGSADGIPSLFHQRFDRHFTAALGAPESNENFGAALVAGDFDRDSYDDLAIGAPGREVFGAADSGVVVVLFGGSSGLSISGHEEFGTYEVYGVDIADAHFGAALAAGDFERSLACIAVTCYEDLAVGMPDVSLGGLSGTAHGAVAVFPGGSGGLVPLNSPYTLDQSDVPLTGPESGDRFGSVLRAGAVDSDLAADLVVGVPDENWSGDAEQGIVHVFYGGGATLASVPATTVTSENVGAASPGVAGDRFGAALATGRFMDPTLNDFAVGVPGRTVGAEAGAGMVEVLANGCLFCDGFESGNVSAWD